MGEFTIKHENLGSKQRARDMNDIIAPALVDYKKGLLNFPDLVEYSTSLCETPAELYVAAQSILVAQLPILLGVQILRYMKEAQERRKE